MSVRKKFVIKRSKLKNYSSSKEMFKYLFQKQIEPIFLSKFNVNQDDIIDFNSEKGESIYKEALKFLETIIQNYADFKIHIDHLKLVPKNYIGIIHINNISNEKNLFFKHYTPEPNNLFYNIIALIEPRLLSKSDSINEEITNFLEISEIKDKVKVTQFLTEPILFYTLETFSTIIELLKEISKWLNKGIIIFQDSINPSISNNKNIVNCTHDSLKLTDINILFLHVSYRDNFLFQPIISLNLEDKSKINYVIENIDQKQYFLKLFEQEKKMEGQIRIESIEEPYNISKSETKYIYFNPYDKNKLLPIIEINITPTKKKTFLLGHKFKEYYNLYEDDDTNNDLVGQVKFNENNTINVDWCEGFEIEK